VSPYISRLCAWAPGVENSDEWEQWARGERAIAPDTRAPAIDFTDSMFRRRLSQISRMTVQVIHDLLPVGENTKILFVSFRGELSRQYQINRMLIEDKALLPAAFSLSVFNAPAALATIALGLKGGYSALYPGGNSFAACLSAAQAFFSGAQDELIFVYADEKAPPEYARYCNEDSPAAAFALLLTREPPRSASVPLSLLREGGDYASENRNSSPFDFLRQLLLSGVIHVSP